MHAALYKSTRPGLAGIYNRAVRFVCKSPYSHCELIFSDDVAASSSWLDGGVRFKQIEFDPEKWDFIELPEWLDERAARLWFIRHEGDPYDLIGNVHFLFGPCPEDRGASFCSEALMAALGFAEAWRYDPALVFTTLSRLSRSAK